MAASWGKFQILGENHTLCGKNKIGVFVANMCKNEAGQIELLANFIRHKPKTWKDPKHKELGMEVSLWDAVKNKDWQAIAFNYNGSGYKQFNYDKKIKEAYEANCKAAG